VRLGLIEAEQRRCYVPGIAVGIRGACASASLKREGDKNAISQHPTSIRGACASASLKHEYLDGILPAEIVHPRRVRLGLIEASSRCAIC